MLTFSSKGVWGCSHLYWGKVCLFTLWGICIKKATISLWFIRCGCEHLWIKADSQHFNLTVIVSCTFWLQGLRAKRILNILCHYIIVTQIKHTAYMVKWFIGLTSHFPEISIERGKIKRMTGIMHNWSIIVKNCNETRDPTTYSLLFYWDFFLIQWPPV